MIKKTFRKPLIKFGKWHLKISSKSIKSYPWSKRHSTSRTSRKDECAIKKIKKMATDSVRIRRKSGDFMENIHPFWIYLQCYLLSKIWPNKKCHFFQSLLMMARGCNCQNVKCVSAKRRMLVQITRHVIIVLYLKNTENNFIRKYQWIYISLCLYFTSSLRLSEAMKE